VDNCCSHDGEINLLYEAIGSKDEEIAMQLLQEKNIIASLLEDSYESTLLRETCIFLMAEKGKSDIMTELLKAKNDIIKKCLKSSTNVYKLNLYFEVVLFGIDACSCNRQMRILETVGRASST
jgi:hypothetical protein